MRPQSIVRFEQAYLASIVLWIIGLALNWNTRLGAIERDARFGGNPQMIQFAEWTMIGSAVLGLAIWVLLWYFVARRGAAWAKWVLVAFLAISALSVPFALLNMGVIGAVGTMVGLLAFLLNAVAVAMLFRADAVAWLGGKPSAEAAAQPFE
ncbi:hypothetical protein [Sphingomonas turrisvirgatae]|uniref:Sugar transporter n=1 Tax=Sphingomonas turrisvirgatae TaxID=1888892 RepID=A0A1E3LZT3_9SPHN|nr:hypothetical protein [Sphingomonas turrisvirgatae]ODP39326.1 hypothetical protein BFL28_10970 [Sphingomonas turrisvirgatae]